MRPGGRRVNNVHPARCLANRAPGRHHQALRARCGRTTRTAPINQHRIIPAVSTEPRLPHADRRKTMNRVLVAALVCTLGVATHARAAQDAPKAPAPTAVSASALNLNSASVAQLEALPGIGRATAERIVEYRQKNGSFK